MTKPLETLSILLCEGLPFNLTIHRDEETNCIKKEKAYKICDQCRQDQTEYKCKKDTDIRQYSFGR